MIKKAVLISGASSGIGAATAIHFSQKGYFVYLLGRNEERLHEVAIQCQQGASLLKADITQPAQLQKYCDHLLTRTDTRLEVLINNAGIYQTNSMENDGLSPFESQFATNFFGTVHLTQKILPLFLKQKFGSILNVSSTLGLKPVPGTSAYSASKAALINWSQTLALELAPHQIRVNCVSPGIVETPIHGFDNLSGEKLEAKRAFMTNAQPLKRMGTPHEIAEAIYFLASPLSSWTTGANLCIDGGINLL